jgi:hypothetical protein
VENTRISSSTDKKALKILMVFFRFHNGRYHIAPVIEKIKYKDEKK